MRKLKVTVTAHDIKKGVARSRNYCPIARAIRRAIHYKNNVQVNGIIARIEAKYTCLTKNKADLPLKATRFIRDFDGGAKVKPFTMVLKLN